LGESVKELFVLSRLLSSPRYSDGVTHSMEIAGEWDWLE